MLSITIEFLFVASFAYFSEILLPAENKAMSIPEKSKPSSAFTVNSLFKILIFFPSDLLLANKYNSFIGNFLSKRT